MSSDNNEEIVFDNFRHDLWALSDPCASYAPNF